MINPKGVVIHHIAHTTWGFDETRSYHINERGWKDIGYNFFVEKDGTVKVGRGFEQGAHVSGHNHELLGYGFAGNFEVEYPTKAQYYGAARHMALVMAKFNLTEKDIHKHSEYASTACPGKNFDMKYFKTLVKDLLPFAKDLNYLQEQGIVNTPEYWISKQDEPMPVWASMALFARILKIIKEGK